MNGIASVVTRIIIGLLAVVLLALGGCSFSGVADSVSEMIPEPVKTTVDRSMPDAASPSLTSPPDIVWDQWVRKGEVQVYVRPKTEPAVQPTVLFFPFMPRMDIPQAKHISREISRQVWQSWVSEELFPVMEYADYAEYYTPERAVSLARMRGADLVAGGYVTNYMAGGTAGDTYVALQIEIYDANSGALVWSMAHAGMMQSERTRDFIVFSARTRLPGDPTVAIVQALSHDMAAPMWTWMAKLKEEARQEEAAEAAAAEQGKATAF